MDCGHDNMSIQEYNKKINGFKTPYELMYFLINCLSQIKYRYWPYCFCSDYGNEKKCEICLIVIKFRDFEEKLTENVFKIYFLVSYHKKLVPYLRKPFFAKKTATCCFLDEVYFYSYRFYPTGENINALIEEIIKRMEDMKLKKINE